MNIDFTSETRFEILLEVKLSFRCNSVKLFNNLFFTCSIVELQSILQVCLPDYSKHTCSIFFWSSFLIHFSFLLDMEHFTWKLDFLLITSAPETGPTVCHSVTKQVVWGETSEVISVLIPSQDLGWVKIPYSLLIFNWN